MTQSSARRTGFGGAPVVAPSLDDVRAAAERIHGVALRTPLVPLRSYSGTLSDILLKPEVLQPVTSFKIRGAYNWASSLSEEERTQGLSTVSAGNTAQALGYVAALLGVPARSRLPDTTPRSKIEAIEAYGMTPVLMPGDALFDWMLSVGWEDESYTFLHPWVEPLMIAGSGTVGLEIHEDLPDVDTVFVSVGGGGLISGVGSVLKSLKPGVRVVAVQPEACAPLRTSLEAGTPRWVDAAAPTLCDGLGVPLVTDEMWPLLREVVDATVTVSEVQVRDAIRRLALDNKLVVEGAGAATLAAALVTPVADRGVAVCVLSGGSIDADKLAQILAG
ncbi:MAG: pyridoxal-phosphate dependent enzyme [Chloroflexi bacterium]|nr:pyridoxal-phosphate dependent enzyme [Chloroflexota bacterium]